MNRDIIAALFPERLALIDDGKCPECGTSVTEADFDDELSRKEFTISGLCQPCQVKVFDQQNDDE